MKTNLKFNSTICTSREQSERLLALGLKKVTADCVVSSIGSKDRLIHTEEPIYVMESLSSKRIPNYPAWSLHRLLELCGIDRMPINFYKKGKVRIKVNHIHPTHDGRSGYNHYDSLIDCIEWLIKEGYFNKEYLV